jgi:hypothetical protein
VPEIEELVDCAIEGGGLPGALGGFASAFGGKVEEIGDMANLIYKMIT